MLAEDLGVQHLHIASNCKEVVKNINCVAVGSYGVVIKEIKEMEESFVSCSFVHEFRASNFEAHKLSRLGVSLPQSRHLWLGPPHDPYVIPVNITSV